MDSGSVLPGFKIFSKIEEMLIAQIQPVLCVYQLTLAGKTKNKNTN